MMWLICLIPMIFAFFMAWAMCALAARIDDELGER